MSVAFAGVSSSSYFSNKHANVSWFPQTLGLKQNISLVKTNHAVPSPASTHSYTKWKKKPFQSKNIPKNIPKNHDLWQNLRPKSTNLHSILENKHDKQCCRALDSDCRGVSLSSQALTQALFAQKMLSEFYTNQEHPKPSKTLFLVPKNQVFCR